MTSLHTNAHVQLFLLLDPLHRHKCPRPPMGQAKVFDVATPAASTGP